MDMRAFLIGTVVLVLIGLGGCIFVPETIYLRNMAGNMVACGPYLTQGTGAAAAAQCVQDYQRQGYERVPAP
jgi:uncharacterized membrane protein YccC